VEYDEIPRTAGERETLLAFLRWQRDTLERKCAGLSSEQLRLRSAEPSSLSLMGLLRHVTDDERGWFRRTLAGEDIDDVYGRETEEDVDFNDIAAADGESTRRAWREECARADEAIAAHQLDDVVRQRSGREVSLRWILEHMVEEYSRHNGHADLLRERIDGATGY
jgi:uncharacterized damage-inducible protein DinB